MLNNGETIKNNPSQGGTAEQAIILKGKRGI
jgi:hypothetical protein